MFRLGIVADSQSIDASPSFDSVSMGLNTFQAGNNISLLEPVHNVGDLLVLFLATESTTLPTPTGYTQMFIRSATGDASSKGVLAVYTKIGTGTPTTVTASTTKNAGIISFIGASGVLTGASDGAPGSNLPYPAVTPVGNGGYNLFAYQATDRNGYANGARPAELILQVEKYLESHMGVYGEPAPLAGVPSRAYTQTYSTSTTRAFVVWNIIIEAA